MLHCCTLAGERIRPRRSTKAPRSSSGTAILWDRLQPGRRHSSHCRNNGACAGLFPAKAGPTKAPRSSSGTAITVGPASAGKAAGNAAATTVPALASSRLKPVPQKHRDDPVVPRSLWDRLQPGRRHSSHRRNNGACAGLFPAKAGPTKAPRSSSGTAITVGPASAGKAAFVRLQQQRCLRWPLPG
jgi:hypothetical protein